MTDWFFTTILTCSVMADSLPTPWTVARQVPLSMEFSRQRILEWVAISSSRGSSRLYHWTTRKVPLCRKEPLKSEFPRGRRQRGKSRRLKARGRLLCCCWFCDGVSNVMSKAGGFESREASCLPPARKSRPQSYDHKELNFQIIWRMLEADSSP